QLRSDPAKRRSWPVYVSGAHARFRCPACVLVIAPRRSVAEWARTPIELGPGCSFTPLVIGPAQLPTLVDPDAARRSPELAVLSAMAHGRSRDVEQAVQIALAAFTGCVDLDDERATLYADVVRVSLGKAARNALEALMRSPDFIPFQSDFARK